MIYGKKIIVVMPAYNAEETLVQTYNEIPHDYVDGVVLVDDGSSDRTAEVADALGIHTIVHKANKGYGGNQKTCYTAARGLGADVVVMLHPDYQYSPRLILSMASMIVSGHYDACLGSRILGGQALKGGMPLYKYVANRCLTAFQNMVFGVKLSEYHTGYRAFSIRLLEKLPLNENSDDFVFDNQMLAQIVHFDFKIGEISCPTKYFDEASSINFRRSMVYGFGVIFTSLQYLAHRWKLKQYRIFNPDGSKLFDNA